MTSGNEDAWWKEPHLTYFKLFALTDLDNGLHGVIPFVKKCKEIGLPHVVGSLITVGHAKEDLFPDEKILLLCQTIEGYQNLSQLITRAQGDDVKSEARATIDDINELSDGLFCLIGKNSNVATFLQKDKIESAQNGWMYIGRFLGTTGFISNSLTTWSPEISLFANNFVNSPKIFHSAMSPPTGCVMLPEWRRHYIMCSVALHIKLASTNLTQFGRLITNAISSLPKKCWYSSLKSHRR